MTEEQIRFYVSLKVLEVAGTGSGAQNLIRTADQIVNYIVTGEIA